MRPTYIKQTQTDVTSCFSEAVTRKQNLIQQASLYWYKIKNFQYIVWRNEGIMAKEGIDLKQNERKDDNYCIETYGSEWNPIVENYVGCNFPTN